MLKHLYNGSAASVIALTETGRQAEKDVSMAGAATESGKAAVSVIVATIANHFTARLSSADHLWLLCRMNWRFKLAISVSVGENQVSYHHSGGLYFTHFY